MRLSRESSHVSTRCHAEGRGFESHHPLSLFDRRTDLHRGGLVCDRPRVSLSEVRAEESDGDAVRARVFEITGARGGHAGRELTTRWTATASGWVWRSRGCRPRRESSGVCAFPEASRSGPGNPETADLHLPPRLRADRRGGHREAARAGASAEQGSGCGPPARDDRDAAASAARSRPGHSARRRPGEPRTGPPATRCSRASRPSVTPPGVRCSTPSTAIDTGSCSVGFVARRG